ncbi:MAG: membrane dipeptidase [Bryobacteraceae bacterium]|jgi:membrane dipeptidase
MGPSRGKGEPSQAWHSHISRVSDKTFWDALETSQAPIFASHCSYWAIEPAPRNMTDEMIRALAKKGGVVQINFSCDFLNAGAAKAEADFEAGLRPVRNELIAKYANDPDGLPTAMCEARAGAGAPPEQRATLADVVRHINHVAELAGVGAVGLGSDSRSGSTRGG